MVFSWVKPKKIPHGSKRSITAGIFTLYPRRGEKGLTASGQRGVVILSKNGQSPFASKYLYGVRDKNNSIR